MPVVFCNNLTNICWNKGTAEAFTLTGSIHVWRLQISQNLTLLTDLQALLDNTEKERARQYHHQKDTARFILARGTLRCLLGRYLDQRPDGLQLALGPSKKPFIQNAGPDGIHYNMSHSGDWILIAVANSEVGIDLEKADPNFKFGEILESCFSLLEIRNMASNAQERDCYKLWTRKEALLKSTGKGIDNDLLNVPSLDGRHSVEQTIIGSRTDRMVSSFEVDSLYAASLAYAPLNQNIHFWEADQFLGDWFGNPAASRSYES